MIYQLKRWWIINERLFWRIAHVSFAVTYALFSVWCSLKYPYLQYETMYNGHPEYAGYVLFFWELSIGALWSASTHLIKSPWLRAGLGGASLELAAFNMVMLLFRTLDYPLEEYIFTLTLTGLSATYTYWQVRLRFKRYGLLKHIIKWAWKLLL